MYRDIATTLYKRGEATMDGYEMPIWAWALPIVNALIFVPTLLLATYTFQLVYPTLAIVEDPSPPAYERVSLNDDGVSIAEDGFPTKDTAARFASPSPIVTSSIRSMNRAICAIGGWRSLFRGFAAWFFLRFFSLLVAGAFLAAGIPLLIAAPLVAVTLVQPYAAWTHIVISAPSPKYFWQRLPPFKKAFQATALPVVLHILANELVTLLPAGLAMLLKMNTWNHDVPNKLPQPSRNDAWKGALVLLAALVVQVFLVVPTQVIVTRVQASFLPEEDDTIVPFDRSFGGKVEPALVGGKGYINMAGAWKSFSTASWVRLIKLYVKVFGLVVALAFLWVAILISEFIIVSNNSRKVGGKN